MMISIIYDHQVFGFKKYCGISLYFYETANRNPGIDINQVELISPLSINAYFSPIARCVRRWGRKVIDWLKAVIRGFRNVSFFPFDGLTSNGDLSPHIDCVLIIRLDAIGDFILWLDSAQFMARHYKAQGKRVVLLANAAWADWASELNIFDDVIPLDRCKVKQNPLYLFRLILIVRRLHCSVAVHPTYSNTWFFGEVIMRLCGACERIGYVGQNNRPWLRSISSRWYTRLIIADPTPCMELIRNAEFVRGLLSLEFRAKVPDLLAFSSIQADNAFAAEIPVGDSYYVLFPSASWEGRQWPLSNFVQVAELLRGETGWRGVVCGSPADFDLAGALCSQASAPLLNWAGRTNLSQLAAVLAGAKLLLTNETSATHLAAAVGVPVVCILGGGHFGRFMPYEVEQLDARPMPRAVIHKMHCFGCNWSCIYEVPKGEPMPCIRGITVADVWQVIQELLRLREK